MRQFAVIKNADTDEVFAIAIKSEDGLTHCVGVHPAGRQWAKSYNQGLTKSLTDDLQPGIVTGDFAPLTSTMQAVIDEAMEGKSVRFPDRSRLVFCDSVDYRHTQVVPQIKDVGLHNLNLKDLQKGADYKGMTFRVDSARSSVLFKTRQGRYGYDIQGIGFISRKADKKVLQEELTNTALGYGNVRRAVKAVAERKHIMLDGHDGYMPLDEEKFVEPIRTKGNRLGRRLGGAGGGGVRKIGRSMQDPFDPKAWDGDGDGLVQEGTMWERPSIPGVNTNLPGQPKTRTKPKEYPADSQRGRKRRSEAQRPRRDPNRSRPGERTVQRRRDDQRRATSGMRSRGNDPSDDTREEEDAFDALMKRVDGMTVNELFEMDGLSNSSDRLLSELVDEHGWDIDEDGVDANKPLAQLLKEAGGHKRGDTRSKFFAGLEGDFWDDPSKFMDIDDGPDPYDVARDRRMEGGMRSRRTQTDLDAVDRDPDGGAIAAYREAENSPTDADGNPYRDGEEYLDDAVAEVGKILRTDPDYSQNDWDAIEKDNSTAYENLVIDYLNEGYFDERLLDIADPSGDWDRGFDPDAPAADDGDWDRGGMRSQRTVRDEMLEILNAGPEERYQKLRQLSEKEIVEMAKAAGIYDIRKSNSKMRRQLADLEEPVPGNIDDKFQFPEGRRGMRSRGNDPWDEGPGVAAENGLDALMDRIDNTPLGELYDQVGDGIDGLGNESNRLLDELITEHGWDVEEGGVDFGKTLAELLPGRGKTGDTRYKFLASTENDFWDDPSKFMDIDEGPDPYDVARERRMDAEDARGGMRSFRDFDRIVRKISPKESRRNEREVKEEWERMVQFLIHDSHMRADLMARLYPERSPEDMHDFYKVLSREEAIKELSRLATNDRLIGGNIKDLRKRTSEKYRADMEARAEAARVAGPGPHGVRRPGGNPPIPRQHHLANLTSDEILALEDVVDQLQDRWRRARSTDAGKNLGGGLGVIQTLENRIYAALDSIRKPWSLYPRGGDEDRYHREGKVQFGNRRSVDDTIDFLQRLQASQDEPWDELSDLIGIMEGARDHDEGKYDSPNTFLGQHRAESAARAASKGGGGMRSMRDDYEPDPMDLAKANREDRLMREHTAHLTSDELIQLNETLTDVLAVFEGSIYGPDEDDPDFARILKLKEAIEVALDAQDVIEIGDGMDIDETIGTLLRVYDGVGEPWPEISDVISVLEMARDSRDGEYVSPTLDERGYMLSDEDRRIDGGGMRSRRGGEPSRRETPRRQELRGTSINELRDDDSVPDEALEALENTVSGFDKDDPIFSQPIEDIIDDGEYFGPDDLERLLDIADPSGDWDRGFDPDAPAADDGDWDRGGMRSQRRDIYGPSRQEMEAEIPKMSYAEIREHNDYGERSRDALGAFENTFSAFPDDDPIWQTPLEEIVKLDNDVYWRQSDLDDVIEMIDSFEPPGEIAPGIDRAEQMVGEGGSRRRAQGGMRSRVDSQRTRHAQRTGADDSSDNRRVEQIRRGGTRARQRDASTDATAMPRGQSGMRSRRSNRGRGRPGVDRASKEDGQIWENLTPEERKAVIEAAKVEMHRLMWGLAWNDIGVNATRKSGDEAVSNIGNAVIRYWFNEHIRPNLSEEDAKNYVFTDENIEQIRSVMDRAVSDGLMKPIVAESMEKLLNRFDSLRTYRNMAAASEKDGDEAFAFLEHLSPSARNSLYKRAAGPDKDRLRGRTALGWNNNPSTRDETLESRQGEVGRLAGTRRGRVGSWTRDMAKRIMIPDPERARRRALKAQKKRGGSGGGGTQEQRRRSAIERAMSKAKRKARSLLRGKKDEKKVLAEVDKNMGHKIVKVDADGKVELGDIAEFSKALAAYRKDPGALKVKTKGSDGEAHGEDIAGARNADMGVIWQVHGMNGRPILVSQAEMEGLADEGWTMIVRGHGSGKGGVDNAENWLTDELRFLPGRGGEAYGSGEYWATGGGFASWRHAVDANSTVALIPPTARRVSQSDAHQLASANKKITEVFDLVGSTYPGDEIEHADPKELAAQIRAEFDKADSRNWETEVGQLWQRLLEAMETGDPNSVNAMLMFKKISKADRNLIAPALGYDVIDVANGPTLVMNRSAMVALDGSVNEGQFQKLHRIAAQAAADRRG